MQEFKSLRAKTIKLVKEGPLDLWTKEADHPEYTKYTPLSLQYWYFICFVKMFFIKKHTPATD